MAKKSTYAHRKRGRKPPQLKRRIIVMVEIVFGLALVGWIGYAFYNYTLESEKFRVKNVQIEGLRALSEDDVLAVSGLIEEGNVLYLDVDDIRASIEAMAFVKECAVRMVFPDSVVITIEERLPYLTLQLNRHSYMLDREGVVLREYGTTEEPITPFVTNVGELEFAQVGEMITAEALQSALAVWDAYRVLPFAGEWTVSELAAYSTDEILMFCDNVVFEIRWGGRDVEDQADRLNVFWDHQNGAIPCNEYLDLRFGADLICK